MRLYDPPMTDAAPIYTLQIQKNASERSARAQKIAFRLLWVEYVILIGIAIFSSVGEVWNIHRGWYIAAFIILVILANISHWWDPQKSWYQARAMSENLKTLSWRYMMRAEPFIDAPSRRAAQEQFCDQVQASIADAQPNGLEDLAPLTSDQIPDGMVTIREKTRTERLEIYLEKRVREQRKWYTDKAKSNRRASLFWYGATVLVYSVPLVLIAFQIVDVSTNWSGISVCILISSCFLGWIQAKRFRELSNSYDAMKREISNIESSSETVRSDEQLTRFVNKAELAFAREHTKWFARQ